MLTSVVLGLTLFLFAQLWLESGRSDDALKDGQRLEISLKDGGIKGRHVSLEKRAPTAEEPAPADESGTEGETAAPATPEETGQAPTTETPATETPAAEAAPPVPPAPPAPVVTLAPPDPALTEKTNNGSLPKAGEGGKLPWKTYARPFDDASGKPIVAILISDVGPVRSVFDKALALPGEISLALSPYATGATLMEEARGKGHETFTVLPLEPKEYPASDPGPKGLLKVYGAPENLNRLHWALMRYPASVGVFTSTSEQFSEDPQSIKPVLDELVSRGLIVAAGNTRSESYFTHLSAKESSWVLPADVVIDDALTAEAITQRLGDLETAAKAKGFALGIARPYPITLTALDGWTKTLAEKGFVLAPASAVAAKRQ